MNNFFESEKLNYKIFKLFIYGKILLLNINFFYN